MPTWVAVVLIVLEQGVPIAVAAWLGYRAGRRAS
jgi:hypothetical protein